MSISQPAPISDNVINQILYLETPRNNSRRVDKCCTAGLGNSLNMALFWCLLLYYSTDFTKWDRFFISGWPALTLASPSLARAQARRDRRRIGCAQRMKWARAPTRFGPGNYTRPKSTWACTQYTVWRLTWML